MTIKRIFIILISLLFANSVLADAPLKILLKSFKGGELVKIPSYNSGPFPNEFMSIKDGSYKNSPVEIDALIAYPKKGEGPFPVLVFNHASGGPKSYISKWFKFNKSMAMQLRKKGIAVMFVDNFTARNVTGAAADQAQVSTYSFYIDAFMTLEYLSKDPRIDIKKVGITGWSRGGMNSLAIAEQRIRDLLISKDLYFAASLPRSVECRQSGFFRNPQPIKETIIWMVNGNKDDASHSHVCEEYGEKIKYGTYGIVDKVVVTKINNDLRNCKTTESYHINIQPDRVNNRLIIEDNGGLISSLVAKGLATIGKTRFNTTA